MISKELFSKVLGKDIGVDELIIKDNEIKFNYMFKPINIHELAHKCKEWAKDKGFYLKSGFNTDIVDDNGDIDFDYKEVDKYVTEVYQLVYGGKPRMKQIASIGSDENSDIKACEWILEQIR